MHFNVIDFEVECDLDGVCSICTTFWGKNREKDSHDSVTGLVFLSFSETM